MLNLQDFLVRFIFEQFVNFAVLLKIFIFLVNRNYLKIAAAGILLRVKARLTRVG